MTALARQGTRVLVRARRASYIVLHTSNADCQCAARIGARRVTEPMLAGTPVLGTAWNSTYRALCTRATAKSKNDSLLFVFYSSFYCLLVFTLEHTVKRR